ncbi:ABC transporter ATP-binding protein [Leifsonia sp. NPDC056824]|uniref:ABC transporter ATP-binding protein n=1 Tax=Leifsonia sp. NPDC056824 TaxID=3345953 RepID=UPI0036B4ACBC
MTVNVDPQSLINCYALTKAFGGKRGAPSVSVLRDITLTIAPGELVAIVGKSGSGKSTLLHCLAGLQKPTTGDVEILGASVADLSMSKLSRLYRENIGFVFQEYNLVPSLNVWENVALPFRLRQHRVDIAKVDDIVASVGLSHRRKALPQTLSGGEQQRVAIARAIISQPAVLFADEPTGALDTLASDDILKRLEGMIGEQNSVVLVTHDVDAAARADRVVVLRDGEISFLLDNPTAETIANAIAHGEEVAC